MSGGRDVADVTEVADVSDARIPSDIAREVAESPAEVGPDLPVDRVNGPESGPEPGLDAGPEARPEPGIDAGAEVQREVGPEPPLDGGAGETRVSPACTIVSGPTPATGSEGHPPAANTTSAFCVATCDDIAGWGCSNFTGRQVEVNGTVAACGAALTKVNGYYVFQVSAGTNVSAAVFWWGTFNAAACVAPAGGF